MEISLCRVMLWQWQTSAMIALWQSLSGFFRKQDNSYRSSLVIHAGNNICNKVCAWIQFACFLRVLIISLYCTHMIIFLYPLDYFTGTGNKPLKPLTHWGRVTHICVSKLTITGSDNGFSPGRRQAIIWTNAGILLIGPLGTNFNEILIKLILFHSRKCIWKCRLRNGVYFVSASMC